MKFWTNNPTKNCTKKSRNFELKICNANFLEQKVILKYLEQKTFKQKMMLKNWNK